MMLDLSRSAKAFLDELQPKQFKQVANRIFALLKDPYPADAKHVAGHPGVRRIDCGEYRVCYSVTANVVAVVVAGKRNDDEVYRQLDRRA